MTELRFIRLLRGTVPAASWAIPLLVLLGSSAAFTEGISISLLIPLLNTLIPGGAPLGREGPLAELADRFQLGGDAGTRAAVIVGAILALTLIRAVLLFLGSSLSGWLSGRFGHQLRCNLAHQILYADYQFLARKDPEYLFDALSTESWYCTDAVYALLALLSGICAVAVFAFLLLAISMEMSLLVAVGIAVASLFIRLITTRVRRRSEATGAVNVALHGRMVEIVGAMRMIRAFGQEAAEQRRFEAASEAVRRSILAADMLSSLVLPALEILYVPVFLGVLFFGWYMGYGISTVLAFLLLLYRLQPIVKAVEQSRARLASFAGAIGHVSSVLNAEGKFAVRSGPLAFERLETGITFRDVGFRYGGQEGGAPTLNGVSFEIPSGRITAVVGSSGAGKSTLINLLCRFYDPIEGDILVDGRPLHQLDLRSWRHRLALAGQDAELLSGSIRDNIAYGRPDADEEQICHAARLANADGFIRALSDGYDTPVGGRGLRLSGGQRQRVALARALLRQPCVLVLDEAMDGLDGANEHTILQNLKRNTAGMTIIMIAHRLTTIRDADHVLVMEGGRIVERGRPQELLSARGRFAQLYELQTGKTGT